MIKVSDIIDTFNLKLLTKVQTMKNEVETAEIAHPGLELTGYNEYFATNRVQIIGHKESGYLEKIDYKQEVLESYLVNEIPLIVFCRNTVPRDNFIDLANQNNIAVCTTNIVTSKFDTQLFSFLEYKMAQETQLHGVLISVFGYGVLIKGASGVGKSEVGLELIKHGHLLVADDAVRVKQIDQDNLIGFAPELLQNRMEIRGIGIVDIQKLYGVTKVLKSKKIDLVVELVTAKPPEDRIGNKIATEKILDSHLAKIVIPVNMGRSISNLVEVAVANFELKSEYDYDSAEIFINDLHRLLGGKSGRNSD